MQWIQIIIFLLAVNGLFALFSVRFNSLEDRKSVV